ncbi:MAG: carboxypeptidase-like regulatory domain-containing protein [Bacteroidales bacterium]|nr:carboxypeptidase-like regulatory domain-containing protein [Bacteroidales bacterium]
MKRVIDITMINLILLTIVSLATARAEGRAETGDGDQQPFITLRGTIIDYETREPLIFATIALKGTNVATVSNLDGEFLLKIDVKTEDPYVEVTYIGYRNKEMPLANLKPGDEENIIEMRQAAIPIQEIVIKPVDPEDVMLKVINNIRDNYAVVPNLMTGFYRETIKRNRTYVSIAEAVIEVFKAPYNSDFRFDATKVYKGRKNVDVSRIDTVLFRLQGGPVTTLQLDIVKNTYAILTYDIMKSYEYKLDNIIVIDEKPHYVIEFYQRRNVDVPLFLGKLFVEMESYALTEAEFSINLEDKDMASSIFVRKKPLGMKVTPEMASYRLKFREQDGKYYFAYARAEVEFKVNWKRKLFNKTYTTMSEIAITDRTEEEVVKFASSEKLRKGDIFTEQLSAFADPDFWGEYNVIEPDQSIESAIRRLNRKLKWNDLFEN